jgi:hypothetical protein
MPRSFGHLFWAGIQLSIRRLGVLARRCANRCLPARPVDRPFSQIQFSRNFAKTESQLSEFFDLCQIEASVGE